MPSEGRTAYQETFVQRNQVHLPSTGRFPSPSVLLVREISEAESENEPEGRRQGWQAYPEQFRLTC